MQSKEGQKTILLILRLAGEPILVINFLSSGGVHQLHCVPSVGDLCWAGVPRCSANPDPDTVKQVLTTRTKIRSFYWIILSRTYYEGLLGKGTWKLQSLDHLFIAIFFVWLLFINIFFLWLGAVTVLIETFLKNWDPPPHRFSIVQIWIWDFFVFFLTPPPYLGLCPKFSRFLIMTPPLIK